MEVIQKFKDFVCDFIYPNYTKPQVKTVAAEFIYEYLGKDNANKGFTITTDDGRVLTVRRSTKDDFTKLDVDYKYASKNCWLISLKTK